MGPATTFFTTPVPMGMREEEGCCSSPHPSTHQQLWCHPCPHSCPCHGGLTLLQVQSTGCAWKLFPWAGCEAVGRGGEGRGAVAGTLGLSRHRAWEGSSASGFPLCLAPLLLSSSGSRKGEETHSSQTSAWGTVLNHHSGAAPPGMQQAQFPGPRGDFAPAG